MSNKIYIITFFITIITGCATGYYENNMHRVEFSALADTTMDFSKYNNCFIISKKDLKNIDARRKMAVLEPDLKARGIRLTKNKEVANCYIYIEYGDNKDKYVSSVPVYGQTGYSSSITTLNAFGDITTNYTPSYGIAGYRPVTANTSFKYLMLKVTDKNGVEVWNTIAGKYYNNLYSSKEDLSESLDAIFSLLSDVSTKHIGRNIDNGYFQYSDLEIKLFNVGRKDEVNYSGLERLHSLENIMVKDLNETSNWNALEGEAVEDVLNRWAKRIGWTIKYPEYMEYSMVDSDTPYRGTFDKVVLNFIGATKLQLDVTFNKKDKVLILERQEYNWVNDGDFEQKGGFFRTLWY